MNKFKQKTLLFTLFLSTVYLPFSVFAQKKEKTYTVKKIVIDAGHGGKDSGCLGTHAKEKDIALNIALKVGNYITENIKGVEVIYTRKKDVFVELHERAAIANRNNADLFISIHCNALPNNKKISGTETYLMGVEQSKANLEVAQRENKSILLENNYSQNYDGFNPNDPQSHIIFSMYQNAHMEQSLKFAELVENEFKSRVGRKSRGVKQEGFIVIYKTAMPSILIETGFLSNTNEETYLNTDEGQSLIASGIYRAFKQYKKYAETGTSAIDETDTPPTLQQQPDPPLYTDHTNSVYILNIPPEPTPAPKKTAVINLNLLQLISDNLITPTKKNLYSPTTDTPKITAKTDTFFKQPDYQKAPQSLEIFAIPSTENTIIQNTQTSITIDTRANIQEVTKLKRIYAIDEIPTTKKDITPPTPAKNNNEEFNIPLFYRVQLFTTDEEKIQLTDNIGNTYKFKEEQMPNGLTKLFSDISSETQEILWLQKNIPNNSFTYFLPQNYINLEEASEILKILKTQNFNEVKLITYKYGIAQKE